MFIIVMMITCLIGLSDRTLLWGIPLAVEHAIRISDSAFLAEVEWYDVEKPNENIIWASGRVHPIRSLWGQLPSAPIEIGREQFLRYGGSKGRTVFDEAPPVHVLRRPIIAFSTGADENLKFVFVLSDAFAPFPDVEEVLAVRRLETRNDSPELREELIQIVLHPKSPELLWKYALRRMFLLEDDANRRFNLLLDPRIQNQTSYSRLYYSAQLLSGDEAADIEKYQVMDIPSRGPGATVRVPPAEAGVVLRKLIDILQVTSSTPMAEAALSNLINGQRNKAEFTDDDWAQIRVRIRAALANPQHPLNNLPTDRQADHNRILNRVLREPNPFAP